MSLRFHFGITHPQANGIVNTNHVLLLVVVGGGGGEDDDIWAPRAVRLCRVLRQPRGNALLVGVGGCGKRSLVRLAAAIAEFRCFSIEVGRGYGMAQFHEAQAEAALGSMPQQAAGDPALWCAFGSSHHSQIQEISL